MPKTIADNPDLDKLIGPNNREPLKSGFTTGIAATAAALAAAQILAGRPAPPTVDVRLPNGDELTVTIAEASIMNSDEALAVVIKEAGDDPDITNNAEIGAIVRRRSEPDLVHIIGGCGVGRINKPGLPLELGQSAINPTPRSMLKENLLPLLSSKFPGIEVEIFVERGEELAKKTVNDKLGITGGISILGTTGLNNNFSKEAYLATITSDLDAAKALGISEVVLSPGRQSLRLAQKNRPDLPPESFIQVDDFYSDSLKMATQRCFEAIGLAAFFGKVAKQADGHKGTQSHPNDQLTHALAMMLADKVNEADCARLARANTSREFLEILRERGQTSLVKIIGQKALANARLHSGAGPKLWMIIFDYNGDKLADITI